MIRRKKTIEDGLAVDPHHAPLLDLLDALDESIAAKKTAENESAAAGGADNAGHNGVAHKVSSCAPGFANGELHGSAAPVVSPFY